VNKEIKKSTKLDHVGYDVRGPVLEEAERMAAAGQKILQLNTGNPAAFGFTAPPQVLEAFAKNAVYAQGYGQSKGLLAAREAIVKRCAEKGIPNVGVEDVYTGNGVSELISLSMQALLDSGDEILIPTPDYPLWTGAATLAGGKAVHYLCDEAAHWYPDLADIRKKITPRTKAIVLINPNNPTGVLYPRELLLDIAEIARQNELMVFADEIYDCLVMDGKEHTAFASLAPDLFTVTFNGLSKSHRLAGYRVGWMCFGGEKRHVQDYVQGVNMLASMRLCANMPAQYIIPAALADCNNADPLLAPGGRIYEQRACICRAIEETEGLSVVFPDAAFYIFPKIDTKRFRIVDDERFVLDFLCAKQVLLVHGRGFNWPQPDHFRIVYLPELQKLAQVGDKLRDFLADYRQGS